MKKNIALFLALILSFTVCSCTKADPGIEDEEDPSVIEETEETPEETEEETEATGTSAAESSSEETEESAAEPHGRNTIDGLQAYDGTWVDANGFVCKIDSLTNIFTDPFGSNFLILSIDDERLTICETNKAMYSAAMDCNPVNGILRQACVLSDDGQVLFIGGREAVRLDSEQGQEISDEYTDLLAGHSFNMGTDSDILGFDDEMTVMFDGNIDGDSGTPIIYDGAAIDMGEGLIAYVSVYDDQIMLSYLGNAYPLNNTDAVYPGNWISYDAATGQISVLEVTDGHVTSVLDPLTDERTEVNYNAPVYRTGTDHAGYNYVSYQGKEYNGGVYGSGIYARLSDQYDENSYDEYLIDYIMRADSPYADDLLRRYETVNSGNSGTEECVLDFGEGVLSFEHDADVWPSDIVYVRAVTQYNSEYGVGFDMDRISSYWIIERVDEDADLTVTFDYDGPTDENFAIYRIGNEYAAEPEALDTTFADGVASCSVGDSGTYFLGSVVFSAELTPENYFDTDPHDTVWGMSDVSGDIPDLVDLDYIKESMDDVFFVSTPEQLASLTYFVNTYPDFNNVYEGVRVDLTDDIDLSGYNWATLGTPGSMFGRDNAFAGIFCGNGHTISNITMRNSSNRNSFFGNIDTAVVVGLNIENAEMTGWASAIMCDITSTDLTDFADCHCSGILPDSEDEDGQDLMGVNTFSGGNSYRDCSYSIESAAGLYEGEIEDFGVDEDIINVVIATFDPEGDGVYDYSIDYFIDGFGSVY